MAKLIDLIAIPLSFLALPVILVWLYDKFVLAPERPKGADGQPAPGPTYVRVASFLLPFVIVAAILRLGVNEVFGWAREVAVPLSWLAIPVGLWCAIDSWILAPRRQIAAGAVAVKEPLWLRALYTILPVLVLAVIIRMITAETLDFSLVLLLLSIATGLVWGIDHLVFRKQREQAMQKGVGDEMTLAEPGTVDYARSFFPVALIVLVVRAFVFEPFRIPSDSMMPTLLDGDFIVVNKYAYGLRLPVLNEKFVETGVPQRGDVVVFKHPPNPNVNYIKRLVGLPGDRVEVRSDQLIINGQPVTIESQGAFVDSCYAGLTLAKEKLGEHEHQVMSCHSPDNLQPARRFGVSPDRLPACDRKQIAREIGGWLCDEVPGARDRGDFTFDVVPAGHYLMIGDNRDNSEDSRVWGLVPDKNLVGRATRIWFNLDLQRSNKVNWKRIGKGID